MIFTILDKVRSIDDASTPLYNLLKLYPGCQRSSRSILSTLTSKKPLAPRVLKILLKTSKKVGGYHARFQNIKPGFHMIVRIVPVVSKKKCSDDRDDHMETLPRRSQTTRTTETTSIAWIELSSGRSYKFESPGSFAIVWVAFPYDRPDRLNIF